MKPLGILGHMFAADGSGFYRFQIPFVELGRSSTSNIYGQVPPGQTIFKTPEEISLTDVVVLQRPAGLGGVRQMQELAEHVKVVYEVDDDLLDGDPSILGHTMDGKFRETVRRCIRLADLVTCSTEVLADRIRPLNENVIALPNCIDEKLLTVSRHWRSDLDPDRRVVVGWAGGHSHLCDMAAYADGLRRAIEEHPDIDFHVVGFDYSPLFRDQRSRCKWTTWTDDIGQHYKNIVQFDIAVAPMAPIPFNAAKSHLRVLESAACGIPVVATDCEAYRDFVRDGETGYLVRDEWEMADRLHDLINDADMRREMGEKAKDVAALWTIQRNWKQWETAYENVVRESSPRKDVT